MKAGLLLASLMVPTVASAEVSAEAPGAVKAFESTCLTGGTDPAARPIALAAAGWTKEPTASIEVPKLAISGAIERNFDFSKPESVEQWSATIDGLTARVVLATFPEDRRYPNLCALVIDGVRNALPYGNELRTSFKTFGIDRKSVDLVHYYEFAGKVGIDKHPVRGEIFTRSLGSGAANSMHIYVAY